jgi:hypothetical protein
MTQAVQKPTIKAEAVSEAGDGCAVSATARLGMFVASTTPDIRCCGQLVVK